MGSRGKENHFGHFLKPSPTLETVSYTHLVPTTWLAGGRDAQGVTGPYEESLMGTGNHPLVDPKAPLEPLRTIHSYDPCMSCAVHVLDPEGNLISEAVTS